MVKEECMRTKADFRALRERCGLSITDIADALGVQTRSVRRWETPGYPEPPEDAWRALDDFEGMLAHKVAENVAAIQESGGDTATLPYWRTQEDYDREGPGDGPFGIANRAAIETATWLEERHVIVSFSYVDDE